MVLQISKNEDGTSTTDKLRTEQVEHVDEKKSQDKTKEVINPKGEYVFMDDGFDMSDFPSDITVYTGSNSSISEGYIFADYDDIYKTDGTKIEKLIS